MVKVLIIGHARHGKNTVAQMLEQLTGLRPGSFIDVVLSSIVYPALKEKYGYINESACLQDKVHRSSEWVQLVREYNRSDPTRMARKLLHTHDIYVGMCSSAEATACIRAKLFDLIVWVDASGRLPTESDKSCMVDPSRVSLTINNNGSMDQLDRRVRWLALTINTLGVTDDAW